MSRIAIVTDSTSNLPQDCLQKHNITVTPQVLIWGDEIYQDGVDIKPDEFYTRLKSAKVLPSTSQVSPVTMQKTFQSLVDQGFDVLGIFVSSKLSGTIQSAVQGKEAMGSAAEKVTVMDSQSVAMALGFQVLHVARALEMGASLKDAVHMVENGPKFTGVYFAVDTLEFLHRGGRIGGAQRFIGSVLNMKPILAIQGGRVEGVERIRTKAKAHDRVLELIAEQVSGKSNIRLSTLHANAADDARALLDRASSALKPVETVFTAVSPVVGTHTGPGTVGLAYSFDL